MVPTLRQCNTLKIFFVLDEFCEEYPHNLLPTPGYWVECSRQKIATDTIWDESESEHDSGPDRDNVDNGKYYLNIRAFIPLAYYIYCAFSDTI